MDDKIYEIQKEMFNNIMETNKILSHLTARVDVLNSRIEEMVVADERSRVALDKAEDMESIVKRLEDGQRWLSRTIISALITGAAGALFFILQGGN